MKKINKFELEQMSFQDIAVVILSNKKHGDTTINIFTEVCRQLGLSKEELQESIGDFYTGLTIDKRFIILKDGKWDLKTNHTVSLTVDDDEDEDEDLENVEEDEDEDKEEEDFDSQKEDDFEEDEIDIEKIVEKDLDDN